MAEHDELTENFDEEDIAELYEFEEVIDEPIEESDDKFFTKKDKKSEDDDEEEDDDDGIEYNQFVENVVTKKEYIEYKNMTFFEFTTMCSKLAELIANNKVTVPPEIIDTDPYGDSAKLAVNWGANYQIYPVPVDIIREYNGQIIKINPSKLNNITFEGIIPGIEEIDNHYFLNDFRM